MLSFAGWRKNITTRPPRPGLGIWEPRQVITEPFRATTKCLRRASLRQCWGRPIRPSERTLLVTTRKLLVASLSACHVLWFLHPCAQAGIVVTSYSDAATGTMVEQADGGGEFTRVTLDPHAVITDPGRIAEANDLHAKAHHLCFIARSVNFPVAHEPVTSEGSPATS